MKTMIRKDTEPPQELPRDRTHLLPDHKHISSTATLIKTKLPERPVEIVLLSILFSDCKGGISERNQVIQIKISVLKQVWLLLSIISRSPGQNKVKQTRRQKKKLN